MALEMDQTQTAGLRDQAFLALRAAMPAANLEAALRCSARLVAALPHRDLDRNLVLVAYGGGKDSSYTLAFVRAMQLILFRVYGTTFRLRAATNRHAGMPRAVLENIDREYQALRVGADPDCELLLIDGNEVTPFDVDSPQRDHVVRRNRLDILMTGHRTFADGRPTFCNACNLSVVNSFGLAASYGEGADLIITGDSEQEQRQYSLWVSRLARRIDRVGVDQAQTAPATPAPATTAPAIPAAGTAPPARRPGGAAGGSGMGRLLSHLDRIAQSYFADIHGPDAAEAIAERRVTSDVPDRLQFFSIYTDTQYAAGDHMDLLTSFLGFRFDDLAFSFTESDCGNPALMAHLRGLKCERVFQRRYAEGIAEYVEFALGLMRKKDFPPELVELMRGRYDGPDAVERMRAAANEYAMETFGLAEEQLVCMAYSPFAGKGAGLDVFLRREHPALAEQVDAVHALLADGSHDAPDLARDLTRISGLELPQLRVLYRSSVRSPGGGAGAEVIDAVLVGDPHKAIIRTRHTQNGPNTLEQISGR